MDVGSLLSGSSAFSKSNMNILKAFSTSEGSGQEELPYPTPEIRGGGQEEQSHVQGAAAAWVQEDQEELFHFQGQEMRRYPLSKVRSSSCALLEQP